MTKKRFALAGASRRGWSMYAVPIATDFTETAELVAMFDPCQTHMDVVNRELPAPVPTFTDFDAMLAAVECDAVIVTTIDGVHHEYAIRAMQAGKDVVVEKPMTVDAEKCRAIIAAERETGRDVTVTFNCRFMPPFVAMKRIIAAGEIGRVVSVDLHWPLDQIHGASYFHRWHARRRNSGGLQVHKCTHHLDIVNWLVDDEPEAVCAQGGLDFYGRNGPFRGERCTGCAHAKKCKFHIDLSDNQIYQDFYVAAEAETGYHRDGCVFAEDIDIEDNYSILVRYKNGVRLAYSLQAFASWEGPQFAIQGTEGRLEYDGHPDCPNRGKIVVMKNDGSRSVQTPPAAMGSHGGSDPGLRQMVFEPGHPDPLGQLSGTREGAVSILIGIAATQSMQNGSAWVSVEDLLAG